VIKSVYQQIFGSGTTGPENVLFKELGQLDLKTYYLKNFRFPGIKLIPHKKLKH